MSKRDERIRERRLQRLVESETLVHQRLSSMRDDLDALGQVIDRVTAAPRRRSRRSLDALGILPGLSLIRGDRR